MNRLADWTRVLVITGGALAVTACTSYPAEPRYATRADRPSANPLAQPAYSGQPSGGYATQPYAPPVTVSEAPPPMRAPIEAIEGGSLDNGSITSSLNGGPARPAQTPAYTPPAYAPPPVQPQEPGRTYLPSSPPVSGGLTYVIQPGDTISGVGRRFQTPVQTLIDLNNLGPRTAIVPGQRITLPTTAVDTGSDPYATGPAPSGVIAPPIDQVPPPPAPPSGNAPLPSAHRQTADASPAAGAIAMQWPVRGDIVRPFGPVAMGERNNGINIGASAGAPVVAAAAGRVAHVGEIAGQGLMVVIVHRDGWRTVYAHLGSATVENNADVRAGQQIGTVGLTAGDGRPSIHFETRRMQGDNPVAIDPTTVLPR